MDCHDCLKSGATYDRPNTTTMDTTMLPYLVRLLSAIPNNRLSVFPSSNDDFVHGVGFGRAARQTNMAVVRPAKIEFERASSRRAELIF